MTIITGRIVKLEIGEAEESAYEVDSIRAMYWKRNHAVTPQNLPSDKIPVGWLQGYSHIEGKMETLSQPDDYYDFSAYYDPDEETDSVIIPYVKVTYVDTKGNLRYTLFNGFIIASRERGLNVESEEIQIWNFKAYNTSSG